MKLCNSFGVIRWMAVISLFLGGLSMTPSTATGQEVGAVTYEDANQTQRIYAFVGDGTGKLSVNYWKGTRWQWADQGPGQNAYVHGKPGVVTYHEGTQSQKFYAFMRTPTHRLWVNFWDGSQWQWADLGTPGGITPPSTSPSAEMVGSPGVVTFKEGSQPQEIHAFVQGKALGFVGSDPINLYRMYRDSSGWHWAFHGTPVGVTKVHGTPGVISYQDGSQPRRIYAFVRGDNGRLYVNYWNGTLWQWANQGTPLSTVTDSAAVITYGGGRQAREIHAFVRGSDGNLYLNHWNGSQWQWEYVGKPQGTTVSGSPGAITFEQSSREIHVFVRGNDGRLYRSYKSGSQWQWADQGKPPGTAVMYGSTPEVETYEDANGVQRIYAFVKGTDGNLYVNYWKGSQWRWADQGTP